MKEIQDRWRPGMRPTSDLAIDIINAYHNDDFILVVVHGTPRIGKSVYALKLMFQVYDYLFGLDKYQVYKKYLGWTPLNVINYWASLKERIPAYTWDDAGCWLFTLDWQDPLLREVQRYFNVVGTDINCVILTTPDPNWILKKIGKMPGHVQVKITKVRGMPRVNGEKYIGHYWPSRRFGRRAVIKRSDIEWNNKREEYYYCKLDDELYALYGPERKKYAKMVSAAMKQALKDKIEKIQKQAAEKSQISDPSYAIYQEVYSDGK
jgi:hypothetical protein